MANRIFVIILFLICSFAAHSSSITNLIVFGDSLSDSGNLFIASGQPDFALL